MPKMTIKEAIEYLRPIADSTDIAKHGEALRVALDAMREKEAKLESNLRVFESNDRGGADTSKDYPCIHYDGGKCKKFSDVRVTSYCVKGPCNDETPSNADRIRAMSDEELAKMISQIHYGRHDPWSAPFARKFCDNCPAPEYTLEDGRTMNLSECDFTDGKCPHGSDIVWWLQQPAEGVQIDG